MAFCEIELKRIDKEVGGLCAKHSPDHTKDKLRFEYRIKGHEIIIYERRPQWDNPQNWLEFSVAKIKYVRTSDAWRMFWRRANGKWVGYEPLPFGKDLKSLVEKIDSDPYGCFFG